MPKAKTRKRPIEILSPAEVRGLMQACSRRAPTGIRMRALIGVLYGAGLRISEALALRPRDIDLDQLTVVILSGKGDKRRVAALLPDAVDAVQRWLDRRRELGIDNQRPLFCTISRSAAGSHPTQPGGRLTREHVARVLRRLARRAGILKRVHPHGLRHSFCAMARSRGLDVYEIKCQMGHEHLNTTDRYLQHLGSHDLSQRIRTLGPVLEDAADPRQKLGELLGRLGPEDAAQMVELLRRIGR